jgi:hypothetical protein
MLADKVFKAKIAVLNAIFECEVFSSLSIAPTIVGINS